MFVAHRRSFADGVEEVALRMQREEAGTLRFGGELRRVQFAGRGIKPRNVNAFALRAGVRAEVNEELACRADGREQCEPDQNSQQRTETFHAARKHESRGEARGMRT